VWQLRPRQARLWQREPSDPSTAARIAVVDRTSANYESRVVVNARRIRDATRVERTVALRRPANGL
jgi:hypothetical protein